jgi:hypothetical protein
MAYRAAFIKLGVDWYSNKYNLGPGRNFDVILSEFCLHWKDVDTPGAIAGYWPNFMQGLAWWNSYLCWITRRASADCGLSGGYAVYANTHLTNNPPYCILNAPATRIGRNQWFFDSDAWATYYIPDVWGFKYTNNNVLQPVNSDPANPGIPGNVNSGTPVYQASFSSFVSDGDGAGGSWTSDQPITYNWYRTPFGACYAVWADPKVGTGPISGDLNSGWVNHDIPFTPGQPPPLVGQAQISLPPGYSTVYIPLYKRGSGSTQLTVQFTNGTQIYSSTGSMNLSDLENYQVIQITNPIAGSNESANIPCFPAMVYPFVCRSNTLKTLTVKIYRSSGACPVTVGHPVVLPWACSWFLTQ